MAQTPIPPPSARLIDDVQLAMQDWYDFFRNLFTTITALVAKFPTTTTDMAIARYDGTTGNLQNSTVHIDDFGTIYLNDKAVALRNPGDNNHGMFWNPTVDGPEYRGFAGQIWKVGNAGATTVMEIDDGSLILGSGAIATNATDGFVYVATCPGVPTGTPTARTGRAPIVIDTTNNRLYFFSNGVWRNAGP